MGSFHAEDPSQRRCSRIILLLCYVTRQEGREAMVMTWDCREGIKVMCSTGILTVPLHVSYSLRRAEEIPVPDIAVAILNGTCNLLLNCSVAQGAEGATFLWKYTRRRIVQTKRGPALRIWSRPRARDMLHTCLARNPVSQRSKTISIDNYCGNVLPPPPWA